MTYVKADFEKSGGADACVQRVVRQVVEKLVADEYWRPSDVDQVVSHLEVRHEYTLDEFDFDPDV